MRHHRDTHPTIPTASQPKAVAVRPTYARVDRSHWSLFAIVAIIAVVTSVAHVAIGSLRLAAAATGRPAWPAPSATTSIDLPMGGSPKPAASVPGVHLRADASGAGDETAETLPAPLPSGASTPSRSTAPLDPPSATPGRVAVIGDSLIFQSADQQVDALRAAGWNPTVFGDPGKRIGDPTIRAAMVEASGQDDVRVVVLATASNDNVANAQAADVLGTQVATADYRALIERQITILGDRCIVLVEVRDESSDVYRPSFAPTTNDVLREVASTRPNTVVVPWSDLSRAHRDDWFIVDMLHFSDALVGRPATETREEGRLAYADAVADGVSRCAP